MTSFERKGRGPRGSAVPRSLRTVRILQKQVRKTLKINGNSELLDQDNDSGLVPISDDEIEDLEEDKTK